MVQVTERPDRIWRALLALLALAIALQIGAAFCFFMAMITTGGQP